MNLDLHSNFFRSSMSVKTHEFPAEGLSFQDDNMIVKAILFGPETLVTNLHQGEFLVPAKRARDGAPLDYKKKILSLMFNKNKRESERVLPIADKKQSNDNRELNPTVPKKMKYEDAVTETHMLQESNEPSSNLQKLDDLAKERRKFYPKRLPKSTPNVTSIAYICKGPDYKGKFNPKSAKALGLKPGPLYGKDA
jgi:ribonuclease Z